MFNQAILLDRSTRQDAFASGAKKPASKFRRFWLATLITSGLTWSGLTPSNVWAQTPNHHHHAGQYQQTSQYQPAGKLQPVPRSGQVKRSATKADPKRQGWNLKWRTSRNVTIPSQRESQSISDSIGSSAVRPVSASRAADHPSSQLAVGSLKVAANPPQLQSVSAAAYLSTPHRPDSLLDASGGPGTARGASPGNNFFRDPFGDDSANGASLQAPVSTTRDHKLIQAPAGDAFSLPSPSQTPSLPTEPATGPSNGLRGSLDTLDSAADLFELPAPESTPPTPQSSASQPPTPQPPTFQSPTPEPKSTQRLKQPEDGPSLGDLLKDSEPNELPEPTQSPESSSDQEFEDPFRDRDDLRSDASDRNGLRSRDRLDRDRLNYEADNEDDDDYGNRNDETEDMKKTKGLSCEDFRSRIRRQTIDQVSLDISPPYRPDEIDQSRYDRLKARFDEKQVARQWRNIQGVPLTSGRLVDLAYEKVVVETDFGATQQIPVDQLSEADLAYISDNWGLPKECRLEQIAFTPRNWTPTTMTWKASNLCHNPLYFEDVNLERYGHTHGPVLEPLVQTAHFFGNIAVLPYKMGVHGPTECRYALGYYRPGNCAPWIKPPVPISLRGAYAQAAAVTGLFWLIP